MASLPPAVGTDVNLQSFNTLAISAKTRFFSSVSSLDTLREVLRWCSREDYPLLLLGGGSNLVFCGDWPGLVLQYTHSEINLVAAQGDEVFIRVGAGVVWHQFVVYASAQGWHGLENLALIPGSVGAAPVQNIGAYGVELDRYVDAVEVVDIENGELSQLSAADCQFGYRDSIFKHSAKGRFVITAVTFKLSTHFSPVLSYPALLEALPTREPTPQQLIASVIAVRQSKLPDPAVIPNAGSFFKNPLVASDKVAQLKSQYPDMPIYDVNPMVKKLPAAWLIDRAGWRGKALGPVAMHDKQALVLTNPHGGNGKDILTLANAIAADVEARFGVVLEIEPQCVGGERGN